MRNRPNVRASNPPPEEARYRTGKKFNLFMEIIRCRCKIAIFSQRKLRSESVNDWRKLGMCLALYLASSRPLSVIAWDPANPAFHVIKPPESVHDVRRHFSYENVYYAGSHQGCSCAFNYEHEYESILHLRDYLRDALASRAELEAFACRIGNETHAMQHALVTTPDGVALPEFFFRDGQFLIIRSGKSTQPIEARPKSYFAAAMPDAEEVLESYISGWLLRNSRAER